MDDAYIQSLGSINGAVNSIRNGHMDPWFHRRQTVREWFSRQDPAACGAMVPEIQRAMVALRLEGKFNAGARMCDVLVHAVERSGQA